MVSVYGQALDNLQSVVNELNQEEDHVRLSKLRSIRNYKVQYYEYIQINTRLEDNQIQLDKARQAVEQCHLVFQ